MYIYHINQSFHCSIYLYIYLLIYGQCKTYRANIVASGVAGRDTILRVCTTATEFVYLVPEVPCRSCDT